MLSIGWKQTCTVILIAPIKFNEATFEISHRSWSGFVSQTMNNNTKRFPVAVQSKTKFSTKVASLFTFKMLGETHAAN